MKERQILKQIMKEISDMQEQILAILSGLKDNYFENTEQSIFTETDNSQHFEFVLNISE